MHRTIFASILALAIAGCTTPSGTGVGTFDGDMNELERVSYERTGDVRIIYYVKETMVESARDKRTMTKQERQLHVLVNRSHTLRQGVPDHKLPPEERFLYNNEMHDVLVVFKDQLGFFEPGIAKNILGEDAVAWADRDRRVTRVIAVEQILDGKINTSYFARHIDEHDVNPERAKTFNECQAFFLEALAKSIPRGSADYGESKDDALGRRR
jgi:hypothetical protein